MATARDAGQRALWRDRGPPPRDPAASAAPRTPALAPGPPGPAALGAARPWSPSASASTTSSASRTGVRAPSTCATGGWSRPACTPRRTRRRLGHPAGGRRGAAVRSPAAAGARQWQLEARQPRRGEPVSAAEQARRSATRPDHRPTVTRPDHRPTVRCRACSTAGGLRVPDGRMPAHGEATGCSDPRATSPCSSSSSSQGSRGRPPQGSPAAGVAPVQAVGSCPPGSGSGRFTIISAPRYR